MKKFLSVVLALAMIISMFTTASAETMSELLNRYGLNGVSFDAGVLSVIVSAKKSGSSDKYSNNGMQLLDATLKNGVGVDYQATLDMAPVRAFWDKDLIDIILEDDTAKNEFYEGTIATDVTVKITYPSSALVEGNVLNTAGSLNNRFFEENGARTFSTQGDNKIATIKYKNVNNVTVDDLDNTPSPIDDIIFTLENTIKYASEGYHRVSIEMSGSTTFTFTSGATATVTYRNNEADSFHIVSAVTDHVLKVVPAVPATCEQGGKTAGVICESHKDYDCAVHGRVHNGYDCGINGTYEPQDTAPLNHMLNGEYKTVVAAGVAPTCTEKGVIAHWVCTLCKCDFSAPEANASSKLTLAQLEVPATGHDTAINIPGRAATCTLDGIEAATQCSKCGFKNGGKIILATGHNIVTDVAVEPTCTTAGKTEGKHCTNCNDYVIEQVTISAFGHKFGDWQITSHATETAAGQMTRTCLNGCGTTERQTIPQLPPSHVCSANEELAKIIPATCDTPGSKQNYCECGNPVGAPEVIAALGHDLEEKAEKPATCTQTGLIKHFACKTCGKLFRDANAKKPIQSAETAISSKNHGTIITLPAIEPTCTAYGWTEGKKCSDCNTITKSQQRIDIKHNLELVHDKAATCEEAGIIKHWHCTFCNKDFAHNKKTEMISAEDYTIAPLGHTWNATRVVTPPTEDTEGQGIKICKRDNSHTQTITIAKLAHVHNETIYKLVKSPTCTEPGLEEKVYTCCDTQYTGEDKYRDIPAEHKLIHVDGIAADCHNEGVLAHDYCAVCNKIFVSGDEKNESEIKTEKLQHSLGGNISQIPTEIVKKCRVCGETITLKTQTNKATFNPNNNIKGDKEDTLYEKDRAEASKNGQQHKAETEAIIVETGLSETLEEKIQNKDKAVEEKVVLDITVKAVSSFVDDVENTTIIYDQKKEIIKETEELLEITISIPPEMQGMSDYRIYRMHNEDHTTNDIITQTENQYGEKIVSITATEIVIKVKRFSEYVLVAYTETQPEIEYGPTPVPGGSVGGSASSSFSIKFNTNGGSVLENIAVTYGNVAPELPVPQRQGYIFAGWYTDSSLTTPFNPETIIKRTYTLYAKWIELSECRGIEEDSCPCLDFIDLDPTLWYHKGVDYVLHRGMMVGVETNEFAPDLDVTRAMLVTVLWRAEGKPGARGSSFEDLEDGEYYVHAVDWAAANGIVMGYSDTEFGPHDAITREQFAAIMYRYATKKGYDVSVGENTNILSYEDYDSISEYAIPSLQYAAGSGLIKGRTETTLNPLDNTTRAEMATILYRFFTENK